MREGDASFSIGDLRSVADAHGFHDWSDDDLRSMMGLAGEAAEDKSGGQQKKSGGEPETIRIGLAGLTHLAEHVGAKRNVM